MPTRPRVDLVCEGGGVRGIALVGALGVLEEHGYRIQNRAGTSAGAIVTTLHAAGYDAAQLHTLMHETDFSRFIDLGLLDRLPVVGPPLSVLYEHGVFEGDAFYRWMTQQLAARGVQTFADLVHPEFADEGSLYRYRVQVIASDLSARRLLVLPRDAGLLGFEDPDDMEVALAVRMSMSIPLFFEPVRFENPKTGETHVIVDGGVLSNYPVWLFDSDGAPKWPTFGLRLVEEHATSDAVAEELDAFEQIRRGPLGLIEYLRGLFETMMQAHDRLYIEQAQFARTIPIPTGGITAVDFLLSDEESEMLHQAGRDAAEAFLARWSFTGYKREFRRREPAPRTKRIADAMASPKRTRAA